MKRLLLAGSIATLLLPSLAFAAYNDVSLTSNTVISVNSITLNVTGTASTIASITVDATNFTVSLEAGSTFKVNAPNGNNLAALPAISSAFYTCTATDTTLEYKDVTTTQTVTVTPSASACTAGQSSSGGSGSSGGGGGGGATVSTVAPITPVVSIQMTNAQAIEAIKIQLIPLIQQLLILLNQQLQAMIAGGTY